MFYLILANGFFTLLIMLSRQYAFRVLLHQGSFRRALSTVVNDSLKVAADGAGVAVGSPPAAAAAGSVRLGKTLQEALKATTPRHDWTKDEIREIYNTPLMELAHQSVCITLEYPHVQGERYSLTQGEHAIYR